MMFRECVGALISLVCAIGLCSGAEYHLYVSPSGKDSNNGTTPTSPYQTIGTALHEIRYTSANATDDVYIELMRGYHEITSTLHIKPQQHPIGNLVIRSYQHQEVHVVGGKLLPSSAFQVPSSTILASLPAASRPHVRVLHLASHGVHGSFNLTQYGYQHNSPAQHELFYNGQALTLARWPNEGFTNIVATPNGVHGHTFQYNSSVPKTWKNVEGGWVYGFWHEGFDDAPFRIADLNTTSQVVTLSSLSRYGIKNKGHYGTPEAAANNYGLRGGYFRFENILSALDQPGEYYVDEKTGDYYVWLPSATGEAKPTDKIFASMVGHCIDIQRGLSNVALSDFTIEGCRGYGVHGNANKQIRFTNLEVKNTGQAAIFLGPDSRDVHVEKCYFHDTDGGLYISGGNRKNLESSGNVIQDNEISRFTRRGASGRYGILTHGVGATVSHNTVYDARAVGIDYSVSNDVTIDWNHIHHVCDDVSGCGAIKSGGDWTTRGNKIRYNILHDIGKTAPGVGNMAVFLDDHHSSTELTNNVFFNNYIHADVKGGRDNVVSNNVFYNATLYSVLIEAQHPTGRRLTNLVNRLHAMPYNDSLWASRYPSLAALATNESMALRPEGNMVEKNLVYNAAGVATIHKSGASTDTGLYDVRLNSGATKDSDFYSSQTGDFRIKCHAMQWANMVNFQQLSSPKDVGPRSNVGPQYLNRSCWLKTDTCQDNPYLIGLERDSWGEEHLNTAHNATACLARAHEQWEYCGSYHREHVIAVYGPTGATMVGGYGCYVSRYGCNEQTPGVQSNGTTYHYGTQAADKSESNCLHRAVGYWKGCGANRDSAVTFVFRQTGATRTVGDGCWIHMDKCPSHPALATEPVFYDAWGAANLNTDDNEEMCFGQADYYWMYCGSHKDHPVTAEFRPRAATHTYP